MSSYRPPSVRFCVRHIICIRMPNFPSCSVARRAIHDQLRASKRQTRGSMRISILDLGPMSREQSISWHVRSNIPPASIPSRKYPIAGHVGLLIMPRIGTRQASDPTSVFAILASGSRLSTKGTASASAGAAAPAAIPSLGEALALSGTSLPVLHILVQLSI
ncbi:MAG: hypothetical protein QOF74_2540 [Caballeronia mineralivorans]|nr:hypothetical protein [Caballeronia mineralivorans]